MLTIHAPFSGALPHILAAGGNELTTTTLQMVGVPVVDSAMFLIPAGVAITAIHKLMEHRETPMGTVVDILVKGGAALLVLELFKTMAGM